MKKEQVETRGFTVELREAGDGSQEQNRLTGYAAVFNTWSEDLGGFVERIVPGAFAGALTVSDVRALYNHDSNQLPLGRTPKTLRLAEDDHGLRVEIDLPDTQHARDLMTSVRRGDISQMSFGFRVAENGDKWQNADGKITRTIRAVGELFDVSPVVFPAYPATQVAARALDKAKEISARATAGVNNGATADEKKNLEIDLLTINKRRIING